LHTYRQDLITAWPQSVILVLSILAPDIPFGGRLPNARNGIQLLFQALNHVRCQYQAVIESTGSQLSAAMVVYVSTGWCLTVHLEPASAKSALGLDRP
jgi:hypothetical protein